MKKIIKDYLLGSRNTSIIELINVLSICKGAYLTGKRSDILIRGTYARVYGLSRLAMNSDLGELKIKGSSKITCRRT